MILSMTSAPIGRNAWRVSWTSDLESPTYRVYVNGVSWGEQLVAWVDLNTSNASATVEVFDDDEPGALPIANVGGELLVRWASDPVAIEYRIDKRTSGDWSEVTTLEADGRRGYEHRITGLPDETSVDVRVVGIDAIEGETTVLTRTAFIIRVPDPPELAFTVSEGVLTIG